jgi:hypothetical protein
MLKWRWRWGVGWPISLQAFIKTAASHADALHYLVAQIASKTYYSPMLLSRK